MDGKINCNANASNCTRTTPTQEELARGRVLRAACAAMPKGPYVTYVDRTLAPKVPNLAK